jgi:hypothetical protein
MINIEIDDEFTRILDLCDDSRASRNTVNIDDLVLISDDNFNANKKTWNYNSVRKYVRGDTSIRELIPCRCILNYYYKSTFDSNNFLHETSSHAQKELDKIIEFRYHRSDICGDFIDDAPTDPEFACTMSNFNEYLDYFFQYKSASSIIYSTTNVNYVDKMHVVSYDGDINYCTDLVLYEKNITDFILNSFNFDDSNLFSLIKLHSFCNEKY